MDGDALPRTQTEGMETERPKGFRGFCSMTIDDKIAAKRALRDQELSRLLNRLGMPQAKGQGWRLTDSEQGEINALPSFRGKVVATDGIMCIIHTENDRVLLGH